MLVDFVQKRGHSFLEESVYGRQLFSFLLLIADSAATLLSESSASADSTASVGPLEKVKPATSAPALRNSSSAMCINHRWTATRGFLYLYHSYRHCVFSTTAPRPRRRVAPMTSPLRLPIPREPMPVAAPLATPEMIDIAPEYSVVQVGIFWLWLF